VIEKAPFGHTGQQSTRTIFGAAALGSVSQRDADTVLELLLEHGVNHIDTAPSYGESELRIAPWLSRHRSDFFLATKTGKRDYASAREEIRRSLDRLGVDHVDLIQLHNLVDATEWGLALGEGGALEAAVEARSEGLARFIGVTGHGLAVAKMHLRSLERFPFDSVLLPYSYVQMRDQVYAADFERLLSSAASAASPSRRSKRSHLRRGTAANRRRARGTNRCATRTTSIWRCTGCSGDPASS